MVSCTRQTALVALYVTYVAVSFGVGMFVFDRVILPARLHLRTVSTQPTTSSRRYKQSDLDLWQQVLAQSQQQIRSKILDIKAHDIQLKRLSLIPAKSKQHWQSVTVKIDLVGPFIKLMAWLSAWINLHQLYRLDSLSLVLLPSHRLDMQVEATYWMAMRGRL